MKPLIIPGLKGHKALMMVLMMMMVVMEPLDSS